MLFNIPPEDKCPQIVELIFDKTKIPTFVACGELPEFPKRSLATIVSSQGTASDVQTYYSPTQNLR